MMQASKKKLVLEHLVVQAAGSKGLAAADLEDIIRYGAAALFADEETAAPVAVEGASPTGGCSPPPGVSDRAPDPAFGKVVAPGSGHMCVELFRGTTSSL